MKKTTKKIIILMLTAMMLFSDFLMLGSNIANAIEAEEVKQNSQEELKVELHQEMEKLIQIKEGEVLLQESIVTKLNGETEKQEETIKIKAPAISQKSPKDIKIILEGKELNKKSYSYNNKTGELTINLNQKSSTDSWKKQQEVYKIIYVYEDLKLEEITGREVELSSNINIKVANQEQNLVEESSNRTVLEPKGERVSINAQSTEEVYKGYLNQGTQYETPYVENYAVEVSNTENVEKINIINEAQIFTAEEITYSAQNSTYYKQTVISKENFIEILGEEGTITIKYGNKETIINKDTQTNGAGEFVVSYGNELPETITIETSKPENIGMLEIKNQKAIKANTGYTKEELRNIQALKETIKANNSSYEVKIGLTNTKSEIKLGLNRTNLSTMIENNVEISVTLKTNGNQYDLCKNPTIVLELPEQVEEIKINGINLLYEEELKIANCQVNGKNIIIELNGEQTKYKEAGIEGALLVIDANVKLNKKATNSETAITAKCTNNEQNCTSEQKVKITSPKEMITINSIKELNIETIGEETKTNTKLDVGTENKLVRVTSEVINNTEQLINNTAILGRFPTNGELQLNQETLKNNLNAIIRSNITVEGKEVTIYYSKNEKANSNIEETENGWTQEIDNILEIRSYLIIVKELEVGESLSFTYDVEIPEQLVYDQEAYIGYNVEYNKQQIRDRSRINSTYIKLETGVGPEIQSSLSATISGKEIQNSETIQAGEVLRLKVRVSNTGSVDIENVNISSKIPEGAVLVEPKEDFEYAGAVYYNELSDKEYKTTIPSLKVGETVVKEYEIRINKDVKETEIINIATIDNGELKQETNPITVTVKNADIRVTVKKITKNNNPIYTKGGFVRYFAIVENLGNKAKNNVVVNANIPEFSEIVGIYLYQGNSEQQELQEETIENNNVTNIGKLEAGEVKILEYSCDINNKANSANTIKFSANVTERNNTYRSNEIEDKLTPINMSIQITSSKNSTYLKSGDEVIYTIDVNANMKAEDVIVNATTKTTIPNELTVKRISYNGEELSIKDNKFVITRTMEGKSQGKIEVEAVVDYSEGRYESQEVAIESVVEVAGQEVAAAKQTYIIEKDEEATSGNPNNNINIISTPEEGDKAQGNRTISGIAWLDENKNGQREENEKLLQGITVQLLNVRTNNLVKDKNGKTLEVTTDGEGKYMLNNIASGEYMVIFKYDNKEYALTKYKVTEVAEALNSNAMLKDVLIENSEQKVASTDIIKITDISIENINLGLVTSQMFDMKLDKFVSKVIIQNANGTTTNQYVDETLVKAEIHRKQIAGTTVIIEYKIRVTNQGEVEGYIRKIADYLPAGMTFNSELNGTWYQTENTLYTTSLANEKIAPGETKEVTLLLTKRMTASNTGTVTNTAEIAESYNDQGLADINSTPANKVNTENDFGTAEVILSISTGGITFVVIATIIIAILGTIVILIKKNKINIRKFKI